MLCDAFTVDYIMLQRINLSHVEVKFDELWIFIMTLYFISCYIVTMMRSLYRLVNLDCF
jgi:hypothetical protein